MYDIIGDIHGYATKLKELLRKLNYKETDRGWQHPERKIIFVGDYIDRGPEIRETLQIIKAMVDTGNAYAIMGNHEYNAIAYHHWLPDGSYVRSHKEPHTGQHKETLKQFSNNHEEWNEWLQWFYTLPVFLELPELRAVHACWDPQHIAWLKERNLQKLTPEFLADSYPRGSEGYDVITDTLKGKEFNIPKEYAWLDKDGFKRYANRRKWWIESPVNHEQYLFDCPDELKPVPIEVEAVAYGADEPPVFFGHYWLTHEPEVLADNIVCLDYSVAKGGKLVAYRFSGEGKLRNENLVYV